MKSMRAGDSGVEIDFLITENGGTVDISSATTKEIVFISPSGARSTKTADFVTDGLNGKIKYVTIAGDFTEVGNWGAQAHVVLASGEYRTSIDTFAVQPAL